MIWTDTDDTIYPADQTPEDDRVVLGWLPDPTAESDGEWWVVFHDGAGWFDSGSGAQVWVTHWRDLPTHPKTF